ncbi:hypothetical protein BKA69DRAFT_1125975 [Paraphysoderma sedebokerense]|nr:hypothetical protein BKA69DRAFT_1125975 [Paraphysoderma sedebokerense]
MDLIRNELLELRSQNTLLQTKLKEAVEVNRVLAEENKLFRDRYTYIRNEILTVQNKMSTLQETLTSQSLELETVQTKLSTAVDEKALLESRVKTLEAKNILLKRELESVRNEYKVLVNKAFTDTVVSEQSPLIENSESNESSDKARQEVPNPDSAYNSSPSSPDFSSSTERQQMSSDSPGTAENPMALSTNQFEVQQSSIKESKESDENGSSLDDKIVSLRYEVEKFSAGIADAKEIQVSASVAKPTDDSAASALAELRSITALSKSPPHRNSEEMASSLATRNVIANFESKLNQLTDINRAAMLKPPTPSESSVPIRNASRNAHKSPVVVTKVPKDVNPSRIAILESEINHLKSIYQNLLQTTPPSPQQMSIDIPIPKSQDSYRYSKSVPDRYASSSHVNYNRPISQSPSFLQNQQRRKSSSSSSVRSLPQERTYYNDYAHNHPLPDFDPNVFQRRLSQVGQTSQQHSHGFNPSESRNERKPESLLSEGLRSLKSQDSTLTLKNQKTYNSSSSSLSDTSESRNAPGVHKELDQVAGKKKDKKSVFKAAFDLIR